MRVLVCIVSALTLSSYAAADISPSTALPELLTQALSLARSVPDRAERADAVGRVAAEIARYDPKYALSLLQDELDTHEASAAMAEAAHVLAKDNRLLGLATLLRIEEISTVMAALSRIVALEVLSDFDEARRISERIEPLTVRRMVEREVARSLWAETSGDRATAVEVAVRWAEAINDPVTRNEALALAAEGAATVSLERAQQIAGAITDVEPRDLALRLIVAEVGQQDPDAAVTLLQRIETPTQRALAAPFAVAGLAKAGRVEEAREKVRWARKSIDEELENPLHQAVARERLANAIVEIDSAEALSLVSQIWPPSARYAAQCRLALDIGRRDPEHGEELLKDAWVEVRRINVPLAQRAMAAAAVASAAVIAPSLVDVIAREQPELVQEALPEAIRSLAPIEPEAALRLANRIADPRTAQHAIADIVTAIAATHPELAERVAWGLELPGPKSTALVALASAKRTG